MKRVETDVLRVIAPRSVKPVRHDVAGLPSYGMPVDVASFRHATGAAHDAPCDTELLADFADFVAGGEALAAGELPPPDPVFQERLRRHLWRTHVMVQSFGGPDTH